MFNSAVLLTSFSSMPLLRRLMFTLLVHQTQVKIEGANPVRHVPSVHYCLKRIQLGWEHVEHIHVKVVQVLMSSLCVLVLKMVTEPTGRTFSKQWLKSNLQKHLPLQGVLYYVCVCSIKSSSFVNVSIKQKIISMNLKMLPENHNQVDRANIFTTILYF